MTLRKTFLALLTAATLAFPAYADNPFFGGGAGSAGGGGVIPPAQGGVPPIDLATLGLPTGGNDTVALNAALATAKTNNQRVYAPCGTYKHAGLLIIDSVELYGDGACSIFQSTDTTSPNPQLALQVIGTGSAIHDIKTTTTWAGARQSNNASGAIDVEGATDYKIQNVRIAGAGSVGIGNWTGVNGLIKGNIITDTLADGIHMTNVSSDIRVIGNYENNIGDDCISVVSYVGNGDLVRRITVADNICRNGAARGLSVVGGEQITETGNLIDTVIGSAFYLASEGGAFTTYGLDNVTFTGNVSHNSGEVTPSILASTLIAGRSGFPATNITFSNNVMDGIRLTCIQLGAGTNFTNQVNVSGNQCSGIGGTTSRYGIYLNGVADVNVSENFIYNFAQDGIAANTINSGYAHLINNHIKQVNTLASGSVRAISIFNSGFAAPIIMGNTQSNGSTTVQYIVLTGAGETGAVVAFNYGDNTSYSLAATPVANIKGTLTMGAAPIIAPFTTAGVLTNDTAGLIASSAQLPAGQFPALTGDCTTVAGALATTCTKTNGVSFGTSATVNTGTSGATIPLLNGANTYSGASIFSSPVSDTATAAASTSGLIINGTTFGAGAGSGTTTFPYVFIQPATATAATTWNTQGTMFGINTVASWPGEVLDFRNGGGATPILKLSTKGTMTVPAVVSGGVKFTASGCSNSTTVGGATAGSVTSGTTGTCTIVITLGGATSNASPNGWSCFAADLTTPADLITQTASSTTTATISGTTVSGDVIHFGCTGY